ncbi:hypothetical protein [Caulifigura coniformis]|uniref:hypothetical protein n=1 Tax=Caulifigura coniformis TaxID=2527983 RepID=UPI00119E03DA|nr:hypothetical protein [Caulifigura coniformis]
MAPVELVLALPIWMLLAAAMVIVGNLGAWKVRGHLAVREAAVRALWPRTTSGTSNPLEWRRSSALMQSRPTGPPGSNDLLAGHEVVRGPQIQAPGSAIVVGVDARAMESVSRAIAGEAFLNEPPALWPRSGVRNRFAREFAILDGNAGQWTFPVEGPLRCGVVWDLPVLE